MKNKFYMIVILFITTKTFSQNWQVNGNPPLPIGLQVTTAGKNFLGSDLTNNSWIKLGVNGNQDIFIDNLNVAPQLLPANAGALQGGHWVGLGRIFFPSTGTNSNPQLAPQAHLYIHNGSLKPPVIQNFPPLIKKTLPFPV
jgi:hypothetical protein